MKTTQSNAKTTPAAPGAFAASPALLRARGSGASSNRRAALPLAFLAALFLLALTAVPASALITHKYLCQITGAGSASTSATECDTNSNPAENPPIPNKPPYPSGRLYTVSSLSLDSGNLWVAERREDESGRARAERFNASSGAFLSPSFEASQYGIAVGHFTGEPQVYVGGYGGITVFDEAGTQQAEWLGADTPSGSFSGPLNVAVDGSTSPADWAAGGVYVADPGNDVVDLFKPKPGGGEEYVTQLTETEPGIPFSEPAYVAVDQSNGDLLVAEAANAVDVFEPTTPGKYALLRQITATPSGPLEDLIGLAVDSGNGDIYVRQGGIEKRGVVFQFSSAGTYLASLASTPVGPLGEVGGIAVDPVTHHLYLGSYDYLGAREGAIDVFGPNIVVPDVTTEPVSNLTPTGATFSGTVNPDSAGQATCQFAWGTSPEFGHITPCPHPIAEGNSPVPVEVDLELQPDTTYFYRLQAENSNNTLNEGEPGQTQEFTTPGPGFHSTSVSAVSADSATLEATIDPHGASTYYYFQYGTDTGYGTDIPAPPGTDIGSGEADVEVSRHLQGIAPATTYHYRVLAVSELSPGHFEAFDGPDHTFTTQRLAASRTPPDGRAWELVSPPDKHGALLFGLNIAASEQASAAGDAITYFSAGATESEPQGHAEGPQVLSKRGASGWSSEDIGSPHPRASGLVTGGRGAGEFYFFSSDLSRGLVEPHDPFAPFSPPTACTASGCLPETFPEATEFTPYIRHNGTCASELASCYQPLLTAAPGYADVPPGVEFGKPFSNNRHEEFVGASPDLNSVILADETTGLTPGAPNRKELYEWSAGAPATERLQMISVLPATEGGGPVTGGATDVTLGAYSGPTASGWRPVSDNGSRVFWTMGGEGSSRLYMRDTVKGESLGLGPGIFQAASSDGSRVFFQNASVGLSVCEIVEEAGKDACKLTDLTPVGNGESAALHHLMPGTSEDGSYAYFIAGGVFDESENGAGEKAVPGGHNLYLSHYNGTGWDTTFIASLSAQDETDWGVAAQSVITVGTLTARVSPNGRFLAFMSNRPLTGYDTRDAHTGRPDEEVYLYDASTSRLICASCNPTGARPLGVEVGQVAKGEGVGNLVGVQGGNGGPYGPTTGIAANLPGGVRIESYQRGLYQPRYLSDSGRLFFNSSDALVPSDANGQEDVYQYEPPGVGDCTESSPAYSPASEGCLGLISSGTSGEESGFLDASENGNDVFFLTAARLSPRDVDTSLDVYDAHLCTSSSPCPPPPPPPTPVCEGDACQPPAEAPNDPTPGSLTFHGAGNLHQGPTHRRHRKHHRRKHRKRPHKRAAAHKRGGGR